MVVKVRVRQAAREEKIGGDGGSSSRGHNEDMGLLNRGGECQLFRTRWPPGRTARALRLREIYDATPDSRP